VFTEHEALVPGVDDDGVVEDPFLSQMVQQSLDIVVHPLDTAQELLQIGLIGLAFRLLIGEIRLSRPVPRVVAEGVAPADGRSDIANKLIIMTPCSDRAEARLLPEALRLGTQMELVQKAFSKSIPSLASVSMTGVGLSFARRPR